MSDQVEKPEDRFSYATLNYIFSSGLRCYECMNCNDQFNASEAKVKVETCYGRCAKTKRDNCTLFYLHFEFILTRKTIQIIPFKIEI